MKEPTTRLQKNILRAMKAGNELTDMGRGYGIYMGETRVFQVGSPAVPVKSRISLATVKSMVENGFIRQVNGQRENGNRYITFEVVSVMSPEVVRPMTRRGADMEMRK